MTTVLTRPAPAATPSRVQQTGIWPTAWIFLLATWLGAGAMLVLQPLLHLPKEVLMLTQFGPSIGVLTVLAVRRQRLQLERASIRTSMLRIGAGAGILAAIFAGCIGVLAAAGQPLHLTSPGSLSHPFWLIAAAQLVGACGEELGWRSFLQQHLQRRYSTVGSAVIVGVMWGTWHVEYFGYGLPFVAAFVTMAVAVSVIMGVLVRNTGAGSLAVAGVFHWLLNLGILLLLNFENGSLRDMTVLAAVSVVAAVVTVRISR
jgi:membrane protease YdiL (CAAX protease family)